MNIWKAWNKFLAEQVSNEYKMKKMKKPRGQLAETANAVPDEMALVDRQKKSIVLNVEKETILPTDVG